MLHTTKEERESIYALGRTKNLVVTRSANGLHFMDSIENVGNVSWPRFLAGIPSQVALVFRSKKDASGPAKSMGFSASDVRKKFNRFEEFWVIEQSGRIICDEENTNKAMFGHPDGRSIVIEDERAKEAIRGW